MVSPRRADQLDLTPPPERHPTEQGWTNSLGSFSQGERLVGFETVRPCRYETNGIRTNARGLNLTHHNTLSLSDSNHQRGTKDLDAILSSASAELKSEGYSSGHIGERYRLLGRGACREPRGGRSRARVHLDLLLESDTCVQEGYLSGNLIVNIRKNRAKVKSLCSRMASCGSLELNALHKRSRAMFYECTSHLSFLTRHIDEMHRSGPGEGFMLANDGQFTFPFTFYLDPARSKGLPKGWFLPQPRASLRVIVMAFVLLPLPSMSITKESFSPGRSG